MMLKRNRPHLSSALLLLVAALMLIMTACGPGDTPPTPVDEQPPADSESGDDEQVAETEQPEPTTALVSAVEPTATATVEPTVAFTPTPELMSCLPDVEVVDVISTGMGITGQGIINVVVHNPSNEEKKAILAAGCYFAPPPGADQQRMMVLQPIEVALAAGQTTTLDPYVACIDADADAPEEGADYSVGSMVPDARLQQLSQCLAAQELPDGMMDFDDSLGLQFAIWQVSNGYSLTDWEEEAMAGMDEEGALDATSQEMIDALMPFLEGMSDSAQQWLDACGIEVETEE